MVVPVWDGGCCWHLAARTRDATYRRVPKTKKRWPQVSIVLRFGNLDYSLHVKTPLIEGLLETKGKARVENKRRNKRWSLDQDTRHLVGRPTVYIFSKMISPREETRIQCCGDTEQRMAKCQVSTEDSTEEVSLELAPGGSRGRTSNTDWKMGKTRYAQGHWSGGVMEDECGEPRKCQSCPACLSALAHAILCAWKALSCLTYFSYLFGPPPKYYFFGEAFLTS